MEIFVNLATKLALNNARTTAKGLKNLTAGRHLCKNNAISYYRGLMGPFVGASTAAASVQLDHNLLILTVDTSGTTIRRNYSQYHSRPVKAVKHQPHQQHNKIENELSSSDSDSDSDLEVMGHRGESIFWRRKIRTFHKILDVNKDGVISLHDFNLLADKFIQLGNLDQQHAEEFKKCLTSLWEAKWGEVTPYVNVEQFLEDMHHELNDKHLVKRVCSFLPYLFKAVDNDQSKIISVEEFKLFFECLDLDAQAAIESFHIIDANGDGQITLKEFLKHGKEFFLTEDESRKSKHLWGPLVDH